jgi:hypothetical protein
MYLCVNGIDFSIVDKLVRHCGINGIDFSIVDKLVFMFFILFEAFDTYDLFLSLNLYDQHV